MMSTVPSKEWRPRIALVAVFSGGTRAERVVSPQQACCPNACAAALVATDWFTSKNSSLWTHLYFSPTGEKKKNNKQADRWQGLRQCLLNSWKGIIDFTVFWIPPSFCRIILSYALLYISFGATSANNLLHLILKNQSKVYHLWRRERELMTTKQKILVSAATAIPLIILAKLEQRFCSFLSEICSRPGTKSEHS